MVSLSSPSAECRVPDHSWSDEELVSECLQGNELTRAALVEKYRRLVYSVPVKYRMPPEDAADMFLGVWTHLFSELPRSACFPTKMNFALL